RRCLGDGFDRKKARLLREHQPICLQQAPKQLGQLRARNGLRRFERHSHVAVHESRSDAVVARDDVGIVLRLHPAPRRHNTSNGQRGRSECQCHARLEVSDHVVSKAASTTVSPRSATKRTPFTLSPSCSSTPLSRPGIPSIKAFQGGPTSPASASGGRTGGGAGAATTTGSHGLY